ncbi:MAG: hypothetical protein KIT33_14500 [Candidatus Kapabacteria bacterium]|nr:hypothetical protein [Ignavibacteriota bacterium]MCW5886177.1 hypothetical protein [Candidatus Kapabacteria bacterium]
MSHNQDIYKAWLELFNRSKKNELDEVQTNALLSNGFIKQNFKSDEAGNKYPTDLVLTDKGNNLLFKK